CLVIFIPLEEEGHLDIFIDYFCSLQYFYTGVTQGINFPEFTIVGMMDGEQFLYYDSNIRQAIPKVDWIKNNEGPEYWTRQTKKFQAHEADFKVDIVKLMQGFNQSGGIHTFQRMYGCELDDETGATDGHMQYRYDGADFISLDLRSTSYVAPVKEVLITKQEWDGAEAEYWKNYLTETCIYWLKKYVHYGKISLERKVPPQVSLLQTDSSSPVVCHATGFYPDKVNISWQKDGQKLHEDVDVGETLPNHDGTFQKRAELKVTPDVWKKNQFTCVVEHKSGDPIHMILTEEKIRTNSAGTGASRQNHQSSCFKVPLLEVFIESVYNKVWWRTFHSLVLRTKHFIKLLFKPE
uniref:Ig-like domain-containing protein n=1 Tax=Denticeps clupeoides TaxID=299321 RepID=A0AAY4CQ22_9TELE